MAPLQSCVTDSKPFLLFLKQRGKPFQKNIAILGAQLKRLNRFSEHCCSACAGKQSFFDLLRIDT